MNKLNDITYLDRPNYRTNCSHSLFKRLEGCRGLDITQFWCQSASKSSKQGSCLLSHSRKGLCSLLIPVCGSRCSSFKDAIPSHPGDVCLLQKHFVSSQGPPMNEWKWMDKMEMKSKQSQNSLHFKGIKWHQTNEWIKQVESGKQTE